MAKPVLSTEDVAIAQRPVKADGEDRKTIVEVSQEALKDKDWMDRIALGEAPVTIRITPSGERNPPRSYFCAVNGDHAVAMVDGKWKPFPFGHMPVGIKFTTKHKFVEVLAMSKVTNINHKAEKVDENYLVPTTSAVVNFDVLEHSDPRGAAILAEIRQRGA